MAETWYDSTYILQAAAGAFDHASDELPKAVAAAEPKRSGRLAANYDIVGTTYEDRRWWAYVRNALVYARPVERGAWVGAGHNRPGSRFGSARGPHMHGNFLVRKTVQRLYGQLMREAMPAGYRPRRTTVRGQRVVLR